MPEKLRSAEGTFDGCFGCGKTNPVSLKLEFERDGDAVRSRTTIDPRYAGYRDFAHGGIVAAILDEAMGWALLHVGGRHGVTKKLEVHYRRPVHVGKPIVVTARLRSDASEVGAANATLVEATIADDRGRVLAGAEGEWITVREQRSA